MEDALEELGVTPTVISTTDQIQGALPLVHSGPTIIKLHGDYLDARIKNTETELKTYDSLLNSLLDRVFDDYGLSGQIYVDQHAPRHLRSSAQGLVSQLHAGLGIFIGSIVAGQVVEHFTLGSTNGISCYDWTSIWLIPAAVALLACLLFAFGFRSESSEH